MSGYSRHEVTDSYKLLKKDMIDHNRPVSEGYYRKIQNEGGRTQ